MSEPDTVTIVVPWATWESFKAALEDPELRQPAKAWAVYREARGLLRIAMVAP